MRPGIQISSVNIESQNRSLMYAISVRLNNFADAKLPVKARGKVIVTMTFFVQVYLPIP